MPKQSVMIQDAKGVPYLIDCFLSEDHKYDSDVTNYPVESGANITDNIRPLPLEVSLEGIVSNTPIGNIALLRSADPPVTEMYTKFVELRDARVLTTIRTSLGTFANMAMKTLSIPRAAGRGDELRFNATFIQVQIVSNTRGTRVAVPNAQGKSSSNATPKTDPTNNLTRGIVAVDNRGNWYDDDIKAWRTGAYAPGSVGHAVLTTLPGGLDPTPKWLLYMRRPLLISEFEWNAHKTVTLRAYTNAEIQAIVNKTSDIDKIHNEEKYVGTVQLIDCPANATRVGGGNS